MHTARPLASLSSAPPTTLDIAIIESDAVAGRALALLLESHGYQAHFLSTSTAGQPGALRGVQLAILTDQPPTVPDSRLAARLTTLGIPCLSLTTPGRDGSSGARMQRLSVEEVTRAIEAHRVTGSQGKAA